MFESIYIPKHSKIGLLLRAESPHANFEDEEIKREYIEAEIQDYTPLPYGKKKQLKQFRESRTKLLNDTQEVIRIGKEETFETIEEIEAYYLTGEEESVCIEEETPGYDCQSY